MIVKKIVYGFLFLFLFAACAEKKITISNLAHSSVSKHASVELEKYLSKIYPEQEFVIAEESTEADIQLILSADYKGSEIDLPTQKEKLLIIGT